VRDALAALEPDAIPADGRGWLDAVYAASTPYRFESGPVVAYTDPRWFSTLPPPGEGAALLELRRWPGDTALSIYAVAGPLSSASGSPPPVPGAALTLQVSGPDVWEQWGGTLATEAGARPALWLERRVEEAPAKLCVLVLPGDAGLGDDAVVSLRDEAIALLGRIEVRTSWRTRAGLDPSRPIVPPRTATVPGDKDEREAPWQVARGTDFTVGLPPGVRARRMDGGVPPPRMLAGGRMWLRGTFVDESRTEVVVGDAERFGYIAEVGPVPDGWNEIAPLGAPGAERVGSEPFDLVAERTGARAARAQRWKEPGFDGEWLVFKLLFEHRGVEIGLPVLAGRRSESLFWIPLTWRPGDRAPAPPPIDPAERFGIRFERLRPTERRSYPWTEGFLSVPGMRIEVPKDWYPAAALRSRDGFPVRLVHAGGAEVGVLSRLAAKDVPPLGEGTVWTHVPRKGRRRGAEVYRSDDGGCLLLWGDGDGYRFQPGDRSVQDWAEMWERMIASAQVTQGANQN
jgi:hypothetical protein